VSGIVPIYQGTNIVGYNVSFINDPDQGASTNRNNEVFTMPVAITGTSTVFGAGVQGTSIVGFYVETAMIPEPSSLLLAAAGLGALGLSFAYRRPKRKQR